MIGWHEIVAAVYGLVIGSFLNVCIHRLPRSRFMDQDDFCCPHCGKEVLAVDCPFCGETITDDDPLPAPSKSMGGVRSQCPHCGEVIRAYDNIPVVSYLLLRGKCRKCKGPISARYPLVELMSAVLAAACVAVFGPTATAAVYYALAATLVVISFIDLDFLRIPKVVTYPAMLAGIVFSTAVTGTGVFFSLAGMLCGAGSIYLIHQAYWLVRRQEGMGLGDADLMAMVGAFLGWPGVLFSIVCGAFLGSGAGLAMMAAGRGGMKKRLPFGPFLSVGALAYLFWGSDIINRYFSMLG